MSRLSRRAFVGGAGAVGGAVLVGCGQLPFQRPPPTAGKVYRLGFLSGSTPAAQALRLDILLEALGELGYVEGQNLAIEYRWGEGNDARLAEFAAELARLPVDLIVVPSTWVAEIAREATTTVPIVLGGAGPNPVALGLAASYAHPGGNVTGVTNLADELSGKRLQLLKEAVPAISRVAVLWDTATLGPFPLESWSRDAQAVGVQVHPLEPRGPEELDAAVEAAAREGTDALVVGTGSLANAHRPRVLQLVARHRWPAMYFQRQFVAEGGLMAYDARLTDLWRRAAGYVDKILRGAKPADLPIEQPMRFDFTVNLATAEALGIIFPNEIMLQVTEVIQ
jgi:putative tryptophan/tyrosine transport system substrate-binding protein